jgi:hypothetical protein
VFVRVISVFADGEANRADVKLLIAHLLFLKGPIGQ